MLKIFATIIKDEHLYLNEWIDYHFSLGFEKCILCEDDDSKTHEDLLKKYGDKVEIAFVDFTTQNHQMDFYNFLFEKYKNSNTWIAAIDVDEYLTLEGITLDELLKFHENDESIQIWWKYMTANGHLTKQKSVIQSYDKEWDEQLLYKRLILPKYIWNCKLLKKIGSTPHVLMSGKCPLNECEFLRIEYSQIIKLNENYWKHCYLRHYYTKSLEDWKMKMFKGRAQKKSCLNYNQWIDFFIINKDLRIYKDEFEKWYNNKF